MSAAVVATESAEFLVYSVRAAGVAIWLDGDRLLFKGALTDELKASVRENRAEVVAVLRAEQTEQAARTMETAACQVEPHAAPGATAPHAAPAPQWTGDAARLVAWALRLTADDLPAAPFALRPGVTVTNAAGWLAGMREDIGFGPNGPRARPSWAPLIGDLRDIERVIAENF